MITLALLLLCGADGPPLTGWSATPAFEPYLKSSPVVTRTSGHHLFRLPGGRSVLLAVGSADCPSPEKRTQAEEQCHKKALARLAERHGVAVHTSFESTTRDRVKDGPDATEHSSTHIVRQYERVEKKATVEALSPVATWRRGTVLYVAYGAFLDRAGRPEPQPLPAGPDLARLARSREVIASFAPFTTRGRNLLGKRPVAHGYQLRPASYEALLASGALNSDVAFARACAGKSPGFDTNDRPTWRMPRTAREWEEISRKRELFRRLAPLWARSGVLAR